MSERNGDRARFHKDRKRKLARRRRIQALRGEGRARDARVRGAHGSEVIAPSEDKASCLASLAMQDEGGPVRPGESGT